MSDETDTCPDGWFSADQLIAEARQRGFEVSTDQLHRWRWRHLIPAPDQAWQKGEGGSHSCYPPETLALLLAVCETHQHEKRLAIVGFELWWHGSDFHRPVAQRALVWYVRTTWEPLRKATEANPDDPQGAADAIVEPIRASDATNPLHRLLRRRVSRDDPALLSALWALVTFLAGGHPGWDYSGEHTGAADKDEPSPTAALSAMFGVQAMATAPAGIPPLLTEPVDLPQLLSQYKQTFEENWLVDLIVKLDASELNRQRDLAKQLAEDLPDFSRAADQLLASDDFAGLGVFALSHDARDELRMRLTMIVVVAALAVIQPESQLEEFANALEKETEKGRAFLAIVEAFPQYSDYLRHDWEQRIATLPDGLGDRITSEIRDFLDEHPETKAALLGE